MAVEPLDFDFFSRPSTPPPSTTSPTSTTPSTCPKCSWHQPEGAQSCAACGIIFAKFAAAEARRLAHTQAQAQARAADHGVDDAPAPAFAADGGPAWGALPSSLPLPGVVDIAGGAARSALSAWLGLTLMQVVPVLLLALVGGVGGAFVLGTARLGAGVGAIALVIVFALVALRVMGGVSAGTIIMMDEVIRGGESRGFVACFGDGFARGGRAVGVLVVTWLALAAWFAPMGALLMTKDTGPALGMMVFGAVGALYTGLRLSMALPAAILGQLDVVSALQESLALSKGNVGFVALSIAGACLVALGLSVASMPLTLIPILGAIVAAVVNAIANGILMGSIAGLWRRQRQVHGWSDLS